MGQKARVDLPLLLPDIEDARDACVARLTQALERRPGVRAVHVVDEGQPQLCLHYDAEQLTLAQVTALARAAGAEVSDQFGHAVLPFRAVTSEDGAVRLEAGLRAMPGVTAAVVNLAGQVARVEFDRRVTSAGAIAEKLAAAGATAPPVERPGWYARNRELAWSLGCGFFLVAGWLIGKTVAPPAITMGFYVVAYLLGAWDNVGHLVADLRRGRFHFNIDLLMVVAAAGAAILGEWFEGAFLLFLFSLGHALEHYALGRARNAIRALSDLAPQTATLLRDGAERRVPIAEVRPGDLVVVKPAERIAVDGTIREGRSGVNQAPITGESVPVEKTPDDPVYAGSVNGDGALVVEVTSAVGDRTLDRVIRLVAEAETQKAPTQQFTDRFERIFVPLVLVIDLLLIVVPPLIGFWSWSESFYRAMAVLVAASPCALALGTPAAVLAGIAQAARHGVLIKGGAHLETLGQITLFAMDKTGTITRGEPEVTDLVPEAEVGEATLLTLAAAVERRSQHPLARAILSAAETRNLAVPPAGELESITGRGVRARVGTDAIEVGRLLMFEERNLDLPSTIRENVQRLEGAGRTTMIVRRVSRYDRSVGGEERGTWLGVIAVADEPREGVRETLDRLRRSGARRIVMLTGDNAGVGQAIGARVGVDEVRAGLMPEDKVTAIRELAQTDRVAMVGDGVNDAPALAHATVGIAMGGAGTAAALETADVALMADDLGRLPFAVGLSRETRRVIRQNLYTSLGVIGMLLVVTVTGLAGIGAAVVVHEGSTLIVIANALRLLRYGGGGELHPLLPLVASG